MPIELHSIPVDVHLHVRTWSLPIHTAEAEESPQEGTPSIKDVFIFLTGCDTVPPLGFQGTDCEIDFDSEAVVPTVSTCSLTMRLPRTLPLDFEQFKEKMTFYILGSQGFGQL